MRRSFPREGAAAALNFHGSSCDPAISSHVGWLGNHTHYSFACACRCKTFPPCPQSVLNSPPRLGNDYFSPPGSPGCDAHLTVWLQRQELEENPHIPGLGVRILQPWGYLQTSPVRGCCSLNSFCHLCLCHWHTVGCKELSRSWLLWLILEQHRWCWRFGVIPMVQVQDLICMVCAVKKVCVWGKKAS